MLKVVIDTNQFVSSFLNKHGPSDQLLDAWKKHHFILVISDEILEEIKKVFLYPRIFQKYNLNEEDLKNLLNLLEHEAVVITPQERVDVIKNDPDDNKFLACAFAGDAQYIISGDKDLRELGKFKNTLIVSVKEFLGILKNDK